MRLCFGVLSVEVKALMSVGIHRECNGSHENRSSEMTHLIDVNKSVQHIRQNLDNHITVIGVHPILDVVGRYPR